MKRFTAIVLAAGLGKRMNGKMPKQYLLLEHKPILYYSLKAFEESPVDDMILVVAAGEEEFCKREIVERFKLKKVRSVVSGGKERYHSVYEGLKAAQNTDYVLIHDGARPFIQDDIIQRSIEAVIKYDACVVGMPVKDTIKILDEAHFVADTPKRNLVWQIQTPQTFAYPLIFSAYQEIIKTEDIQITDDAMVLEYMTGKKIKVVEGDYRNIKITTPEDMAVARAYASEYQFS